MRNSTNGLGRRRAIPSHPTPDEPRNPRKTRTPAPLPEFGFPAPHHVDRQRGGRNPAGGWGRGTTIRVWGGVSVVSVVSVAIQSARRAPLPRGLPRKCRMNQKNLRLTASVDEEPSHPTPDEPRKTRKLRPTPGLWFPSPNLLPGLFLSVGDPYGGGGREPKFRGGRGSVVSVVSVATQSGAARGREKCPVLGRRSQQWRRRVWNQRGREMVSCCHI